MVGMDERVNLILEAPDSRESAQRGLVVWVIAALNASKLLSQANPAWMEHPLSSFANLG